MNERIRELMKQAGQIGEYVNYGQIRLSPEQFEQKIAELIVEECRYVMDCNKGSDQHPEWNRALSETSDKIREHFGVE